MQDRFRFRAWSKVYKRMFEVFSFNENFVHSAIGDDPVHTHNQVVLMQCTGLKDKNGKLIYEGDIVKETLYRAGTICDETYLAVVHDSCIFRFEPDMVFTDLHYHHHKVEVVGNIYENPELLNKEE